MPLARPDLPPQLTYPQAPVPSSTTPPTINPGLCSTRQGRLERCNWSDGTGLSQFACCQSGISCFSAHRGLILDVGWISMDNSTADSEGGDPERDWIEAIPRNPCNLLELYRTNYCGGYESWNGCRG